MSHFRHLSGLRPAVLAAASVAALGLASPALSQTSGVEAQRQAVFQQLLAAPADRELMRQYAALSVQLRDFEAAAATLERLVDLEPANSQARLELAVAYFALGNYDLAEYHMAAAQASGALSADDLADVARYRAEAAERDQPSRFSGRVALGQAFTEEADEQGLFANAALEWRLDMGGANADDFLLELGYSAFQPGDDSFSDRQNFRLRAGPEFRLSGDAYGPRLQPYLELQAFRDDEFVFGDFDSWALGLAYQNPINASWTVYSDLSYGEATVLDEFGEDFDFTEFEIGATWRPSRETRLRATLAMFWQEGEFGTDRDGHSLRLAAQHAFDPGFVALPRRWLVGAFGEIEETEIDYSGFFGETVTENALGVWLRAFVTEEIFLETRATQINRETDDTFSIFEEEETIFSVQIGWEF